MTISVLINIDDNQWTEIENLHTQIKHILQVAGEKCLGKKEQDIEISVLLTGDDNIQKLNKEYRGKDGATNVLSFPAMSDDYLDRPILLGDIILSYETILQESTKDGKAQIDHISHLLVHGLLHLCGYDHEDDESAADMESLEISILEHIGIPNPY